MGIVVCISMMLGLVVLRPTPWSRNDDRKQSAMLSSIVAVALIGFGAWNVFYGLNHLAKFWGWAGLASGVVMILAAVLIFFEQVQGEVKAPPIKTIVTFALAVFFLLYAVTLIQLNLGYPIIGSS